MRFIITICFILGCFHLSSQQFTELSDEIGFAHVTYDPNQMSGGVSIIDYNNDGYEDIYLTGGKYPDHLYKNMGDASFIDVTQELGLMMMEDYYTVGVVAGDFDNDGFTDLLVTTQQGQKSVLLKNDNGQSFKNVSEEAGIFGTKWSTSPSLADIDQDGDLDLYISNFVSFTDDPFFRHITAAEPNHFIENKGPWSFGRSEISFEGETDGCTLVSCFTDVDNDLDPDLFIINDFGSIYTGNELFYNDGHQMTDRATDLAVDIRMDGMGIAIGDVDGNGFNDYYLSNIGVCPFLLNKDGVQFSDGNIEYRVNDGLGFSWGAFFADINNDSYLDLFIAKGSISESNDPQFNRLYLYYPRANNFRDVSSRAGIDNPHRGRGVAYADLNNDGLLDMVVNNVRIREDNEGVAQVYLNRSDRYGNHFKLKLEGVESNQTAIGSRIELYTNDRILRRDVTGGSSYLSNNSYIVHFGLGDNVVDSVIVHWPSGNTQKFFDINVNSFYYLKEGDQLKNFVPGNTTSAEYTEVSQQIEFKIYPNPAQDHLTLISLPSILKDASLNVFDKLGKRLINQKLNAHPHTSELILDISPLPSGVYTLCFAMRGVRQCKKFVVID